MSETDRKYRCPVCSKSYTKSHTVKVHMRLHTGHRPHTCHICSKSFVTSSAVKDHLVSHMNSRDFICKRCGSKFKHKGTLKRHQAQHDEYEKKRDAQESIETAVVYESSMPFDQPDTKYFIISAEEARLKFPEIQEILSQKSPEVNTHAILSDADANCHATVVKQERLEEETPYGAAVLELTEDNVYDQEGINVRVYNVSEDHTPDATSAETTVHSPTKPIYRPRIGSVPSAVPEITSSDIAVSYGSHVTRLLSLISSPEKQATLIQKLNKTMHTFIVNYRK